MGRISGGLWVLGGLIGILGAFLPGADHASLGWVFGLSGIVLLYGIGSVTGVIPWQRASMRALALGMVFTVPVVGIALGLTGASISYIEPLLVCSLLYAAFFFPARWAWPLSIELVLTAGTPLLYDPDAIDHAYAPRYLALVCGFLAVTAVTVRLKSRLVAAEAHQREIANRDPLTGIANRRAFEATLRRELGERSEAGERREDEREPLALLLLDLDDFKGINDDYGHQAGDAILCEVARRALAITRSTDTLARIGGDEFAVIAPGSHGEGARRLAEAISSAVALGGSGSAAPSPKASIGWAVFPGDGEDFETLMRRADERLLRLKGGARNGRLATARSA